MMTVARNIKCAAGIAVALAMGVHAQVRDVRREVVGTASITGTVIGADTAKTPLRRARVTFTGGALVAPRVTITDDTGRFVMTGLTAGQYTISADKTGYLRMNYGATRPSRLGMSVVLADGERATGLSIALPRAAAISGKVTNGAGEPEPDVQVTALYWQLRNGERTLVPVESSIADDRGEYRLAGLSPGNYFVSVEPPDAARGPADILKIADGAVDRALQGTATAGQPSPSLRPIGPAPVYFPGTVRPARASTVTLAIGEERSGVDIRTELVPMARINGSVSADGQPVQGVQVTLVSLGPPAPNFAYAVGGRLGPRTTDAKGQFAFVGVPPGEYRLQAMTRSSGGRTGEPASEPSPRMAFATVEVDGTDHTFDLTLQEGMSITGRFVFEGGTAPVNLAGTQLTLEGLLISPGAEVSIFRTDALSDGTFRAAGLTPGRFLLRATAPASTASSGWALKSIVRNTRDLLDAPFELAVGEILSDVLVTFTNQPSELAGTLQNSSGTPTSDFFILVYSTDAGFWFPNSRRVVSVRPNSAGAFNIRNLPPGNYFISAVTDVETGEWFLPEFLRVLVDGSPIKITIGEGEKKRQDLRVGK
jgi:protocatechuate 3,4-dioxygenase beta subunit